MKRLIPLAAGAALFLAPALAQGEARGPGLADARPQVQLAAQDEADLQCLVAIAAFGDAGGQELEALVNTAVFYYIGRLQGRTPDVNWPDRMMDWIVGMSDDDLQTLAGVHQDRCLGEVLATAQQLENAGSESGHEF